MKFDSKRFVGDFLIAGTSILAFLLLVINGVYLMIGFGNEFDSVKAQINLILFIIQWWLILTIPLMTFIGWCRFWWKSE